MWFWWFMLICDLIIPIVMVIVGRMMWKHCPKHINGMSGYRTPRSMKNMDTWKFAHDYCGRLWWKIGWVMIIPFVLIHIPLYHSDMNTIGLVGIILVTIQCIIMIASIYPTEKALKKHFNDDGTPRQIEICGGKRNMELWDAYDRDFKKIQGVTLVRGEAIPEGFFHLVCEIIVRHIDGSYLIMQRDKRKHLGGMWEATAGGSALKGEDPVTCAARELHEETGITSDNLVEIGRVLHHSHKSFYVEYLCITDVDKDSIVLQEGETSDYKWITADELLKLSRDELATQRILNFIEELN